MSVMGSKSEIEKFSRDKEFGLWRVNMVATLTQEKCIEAWKGETLMPAYITQLEIHDANHEFPQTTSMFQSTSSLCHYNYEVLFALGVRIS